MRASPSPLICERVRSQISLLLDAEVSELDRRLVAAHLARCAECRAFEQPVRAFTEQLRATPLEVSSLPVVLTRIRARQRVWLRTAELSAVATVLIVLGVVSQLGAPRVEGRSTGRQFTTASLFKTTSWQPELEMAQIDSGAPVGPTRWPGPLPAL